MVLKYQNDDSNIHILKQKIDRFLNQKNPDRYIDLQTFMSALEIYKNISNIKKLETSIIHQKTSKGIENNTQFLRNRINHFKQHQDSENCKIIEQSYSFKNKNEFRKIFKKKAKNINPKKCKKSTCLTKYKKLNKDYTKYMENC